MTATIVEQQLSDYEYLEAVKRAATWGIGPEASHILAAMIGGFDTADLTWMLEAIEDSSSGFAAIYGCGSRKAAGYRWYRLICDTWLHRDF